MCHQCRDEIGVIEAVTLVYDDGVVRCKDCIEKRKLHERQRQRDGPRNIVGDCIICQKPVVKGGEVCICNVEVYNEY